MCTPIEAIDESEGGEDDYLFPRSVLLNSKVAQEWSEHLSSNNMCLRPLHRDDFRLGYGELLSDLTDIGSLDIPSFQEQFDVMRSCRPIREYICVIEHTEDVEQQQQQQKRVIGSATLQLEYKFIHSAATRARVEDVVVHNQFRGKKLAKVLLTSLVGLSKALGAYKCSLECKDHLIKFYGQFGFNLDTGNNYLVQRFPVVDS